MILANINQLKLLTANYTRRARLATGCTSALSALDFALALPFALAFGAGLGSSTSCDWNDATAALISAAVGLQEVKLEDA